MIYKDRYHRTIKMRHCDVEPTSYIYLEAQDGYKGPKFKVSPLFGAFKLPEKSDSGKYFYAGYDIGFGARYLFHI